MQLTRSFILTGGICLVMALAAASYGRPDGASGQSSSSSAASSAPAAAAKAQSEKTSKLDANAPENDDALHLTDDQKSRIKSIRDDAKQRERDVQKDASLDDEAKERKVREIRKETRAQVWGVMTPDQQQQWANEQRARREARRAGSKPQD
ncbi:MAG: hypothetical protein WCA00_07980 [Candidatus Acidiferrales bacterium]